MQQPHVNSSFRLGPLFYLTVLYVIDQFATSNSQQGIQSVRYI